MNAVNIPSHIQKIMSRLQSAGFQAVVVGGCVRDSLLDIPVKDWDVATSATPDEVKKVFAGKTASNNGEAHGTILVLTDVEPVEVTTFRRRFNRWSPCCC